MKTERALGEAVVIGPLLACAIGDAYGAGFEFISPKAVADRNNLSRYFQHPKWSIKPGSYTDDTQMATSVAEHLLSNRPWIPSALATTFVGAFHRDPRTGYAKGFYEFLLSTKTGDAFLAGILPHSEKNGGAMRAFPVGFYPAPGQVRNLAMFQASLTHATWDGMTAASAAALIFHFCYHRVGPKERLPMFLDSLLPGVEFSRPWRGFVSANGLETVKAALWALLEQSSLSKVLQAAVKYTGDVDTVAAIVMPAAAVCDEIEQDLPQVLIDGLENGPYGREYLQSLDKDLATKFPRKGAVTSPKVEQEKPGEGLWGILFGDD